MDIDEKFAEAWVNSKHKVFGYKLKPFSCWHKFLLGVYDSPFISQEDKDPEVEDIINAVLIFRLSYPQVPKPSRTWMKIRFFLRSWKIEQEALNLRLYFEDFLAFPEFWKKENEDTTNRGGPPDVLSTTTALLSLGIPEKNAWDMPIGKAFWYASAYAMQLGADLDFITAKERAMEANIDNIREDMEVARQKFMAEQAKNG